MSCTNCDSCKEVQALPSCLDDIVTVQTPDSDLISAAAIVRYTKISTGATLEDTTYTTDSDGIIYFNWASIDKSFFQPGAGLYKFELIAPTTNEPATFTYNSETTTCLLFKVAQESDFSGLVTWTW